MSHSRYHRTIWNNGRASGGGRLLTAFRAATTGSAAAKFAILLAMVVGVALIATRFLGGATENAFAKVFDGVNPDTSAAADARRVSSAARSDVAETGDRVGLFDFRLLAAEFVALISLGSLLYVVRTVRKRRELLGGDQEVPATVGSGAIQNRLFKKRQQIYRLLSNDMDTVLASRMDVGHIMSHQVTTVLPSTTAEEVREMMVRKKLRHMMVCDGKGDLVGILSDRDLAKTNGTTAADLMTANPITVTPETLISPAVTLMIDRHISCLPVVDDDGKLHAVLTSTDLMMALQCAMQILHKLATQIGGPENLATRPNDALGQPSVAVDSKNGSANLRPVVSNR